MIELISPGPSRLRAVPLYRAAKLSDPNDLGRAPFGEGARLQSRFPRLAVRRLQTISSCQPHRRFPSAQVRDGSKIRVQQSQQGSFC